MTSNMIYIVALVVGFKCPRKIHLNTLWGGGGGQMGKGQGATVFCANAWQAVVNFHIEMS